MPAALVTFALMVAYWPGISGAATTPRWGVGVLFALLLFFAPTVNLRRVHWLGLALIGWLLVTLIWSEGRADGVDQAAKLLTIACAFAFGSTLHDVRAIVIAACCGVAVSSALVILDAIGIGLSALPSYGAPAGLFYNPDWMASAAALVFVAAIATGLWRWSALAVPALLLSGYRTAGLEVIAAVAVMLWPSLDRAKRAIGVGVMIAGAAAFAGYKIVHGADFGITERWALWHDTALALTVFGHGFGSFWESFPHYAQTFDLAKSRPEHPHNEWLWLAYEGGIPALALGVAFAVALVRTSIAGRAVLAALFVESCLFFPFHLPATAILGAVLAGHFAGGLEPVGAVARGSRLSLRAWLYWPRRAVGSGRA